MKLYTFPASPNSLKVTATACHVGVALDLVMVDLGKRDQLKPEFGDLNPNRKIPTLVDGDFVLWESTAIMFYLAEKAGAMIPSDMHDRMRMHQWISWNLAHMGPACGALLFERVVKGLLKLGEPDAAAIKQGEGNFHRFAQVLNGYLKGREYMVGNALSLADYHLVAQFVHAEAAAYPLADYTEISRWSAALLASESWRRALADMG